MMYLYTEFPNFDSNRSLFHYLYLPASTFCNVLGSSSAFAWIQISRLNNPSVISLKIQASLSVVRATLGKKKAVRGGGRVMQVSIDTS
jgi:hypothetical protein